MEGVLQVAALLVALGTAAPGTPIAAGARPTGASSVSVVQREPSSRADARSARPDRVAVQVPADSWTGEDKFRHAAASWAAMVFTYAGTRAVHDDSDTAIAVAIPVTAAFGVAKEIVDHRRGGPFSFRDLAADALGAGAAWLFLREMR